MIDRWAEAVFEACRAYGGVTEKQPWGEGETAFQVGGRTFAFVVHGEGCSVSAKPEAGERDAFLALPGFEPAPYLARHGWLRIRVADDDGLARARLLIDQSYGLFARATQRSRRRRD